MDLANNGIGWTTAVGGVQMKAPFDKSEWRYMETSLATPGRWTGLGRWLSLAVAATLLITVTVVMIVGRIELFTIELQASIGWDVVIGLGIFGAIASGYRHAPMLLVVTSAIFAVRVVLGVARHMHAFGIVLDILLTTLACGAAIDLRRQGLSPAEPDNASP